MRLWLASYPRSGSTPFRLMMNRAFGPDALRLVRTHARPTDARPAVYLVRDGRTACRAAFDRLAERSPHAGYSVADVIAGRTPAGSWGEHLDAWTPDRRPHTLIVRYEDFLADPAGPIAALAAFTGLTPNPGRHGDVDPPPVDDPTTALPVADLPLFWAAHRDWMARLGYPTAIADGPADGAADGAAVRQALRREGRRPDRRRVRRAEAAADRLRGEAAALRGVHADLLRRLAEADRAGYVLQKRYAESLQAKVTRAAALTAAVRELHARMRLLLGSRFIRLGWNLGFGRTPYWADPNRDELSPLLDTLGPPPPPVATAGGTDMDRALAHLHAKGFRPRVVLDVGSAKGYWSVTTALVWPDARFFLIDPLPQSEPALRALSADPRFRYVLTAVGAAPGEAVINVAADPDSSTLLADGADNPHVVGVETVDRLIAAGRVDPPDLVKLDVQGFEMQVLAGGRSLFDSADVFVVETNLFAFMPGCPRLHEVVAHMAARGFYPFDLAGTLRRPFEDDLGQADVVFVRGTSPMVADNRWVAFDGIAATEPGRVGPGVAVLGPAPRAAGAGGDESGPGARREAARRSAPGRHGPAPSTLAVSVVLCTKDPRPDILARVLASLDRQTLWRDQWELVLVDNASDPPVDVTAHPSRPRVVVEPTPGLGAARSAGIAAAAADLLVFVDDDNFLAADYLERAVAIAAAEPRVGLFGGVSVAELESPIPPWKRPVLPYLGVRDHGPTPITAFADHWGEWEPIGAGMVARRPVAERFARMRAESPDARRLGRAGSSLLSGEDALFARAAHRLGFSCSYQPALRLTHYLKRDRLRVRYLARLLAGHGRSFVLLGRSLGQPTADLKLRTAVARLLHRLRTAGRAGAITWFWDLGYAAEKHRERRKRNEPQMNTDEHR